MYNYEGFKILFDYLGNRVVCFIIIVKDLLVSIVVENVFILLEIYFVDRYIWVVVFFNIKSSVDWFINIMYGDFIEEIIYWFLFCFGGYCIFVEEILIRKKVIDLYVNGEYKMIIIGEGYFFGMVFDSMGMLRDFIFNGFFKDFFFMFKFIVDGFLYYGLK